MKKMKDLLSLNDLSKNEILDLISSAEKLKKNPKRCEKSLDCKTLLMLFAKPSLRTHLSFDVAMHQLGGHAIFYDMHNSTLGEKESIKDFAKVTSRYVSGIMARLYDHNQILELAENSDVPVINGLTNAYHPCQALGDLLTIKEHFKGKKWGEISIAYLGDANNNVTHSLIEGANKLGMGMIVSCPKNKKFMPNEKYVNNLRYTHDTDPKRAVYRADVIYTDSWMSYQIPKKQEKSRINSLKKFQITGKIMKSSKKNPIFMHCLPAHRNYEVTDEVMDSPQSKIYDQAENRLWTEKAILLKLLGKS